MTLGFLGAAIKKGAKVYEKSAVRKITFTRKTATAFLDGGAITTTNLAICIGEPTSLFKPLKRHLRHEDRYAVLTEPLSAAVRAELGQRPRGADRQRYAAAPVVVHRDHRALFTGADQKRPADRLRNQTLVQRTGQLMYELSRLYPAISGALPGTDGTCRWRIRLTACSMRARTGTFRFIILRSGRRTIPRARISQAASSFAVSRAAREG